MYECLLFQATFAEYEAVIAIKTLKVMEGELPRKQLKKMAHGGI